MTHCKFGELYKSFSESMVKLERQAGHTDWKIPTCHIKKKFRLDPIGNGEPAKDFFKSRNVT